MKEIRIAKTLNHENGSIEIKYEGLRKNPNIDDKQISEILEKNIEKMTDDMIENILYLRTILKPYEEVSLSIYYKDLEHMENIKYLNGNLSFYEKTNNVTNHERKNKYTITYDLISGLKLDWLNIEAANNLDSQKITEISKEISDIMEYILSLKEVRALTLDSDAKLLIEIYKLFYNEDPNFSDENIHFKVQPMMSILDYFGVSLGTDYVFVKSFKTPMSLRLIELVKKLSLFGQIKIEEPFKIKDYLARTIKIVGEVINENIDKNNNENDLINISQIFHAARYNLSLVSDKKKICKLTDCSIEELESCILLVKKIERKIKKAETK